MQNPPRAVERPQTLESFGDRREDPYFYFRDREDPAVMAYIQAENAYAAAEMGQWGGLEEEIYQDMLGRIEQTDMSVPSRFEGYFYYTRTEEGKQYSILARKKGTIDGEEEVLLDSNELARGRKFFSLGLTAMSPDQMQLAYATDTTGYREYKLEIRDLRTGGNLADVIEKVASVVWAEDGETLFYAREQAQTKRSYQVWRHRVGRPVEEDVLVYEESDERFRVGIGKTLSKGYLVLTASSGKTSEAWVLDARRPEGEFRLVLPRREGISYGLTHHGWHFYLRINDTARDFRVARMQVEGGELEEVIAPAAGQYVQGMVHLERHAVYLMRLEGLPSLRVVEMGTGAWHEIAFEEAAYSLGFGSNAEFHTDLIRFQYSSMVTPQSTFDYNLVSRERVLLKQQKVLGGYDAGAYVVERTAAESVDGVRVPMTIAYRKGLARDGSGRALLYGYGSYAIAIDPGFSASRLALLDRGFAYAIAHIRGGTDLGYSWYEDGKLLRKKNTFSDFIACAEKLVKEGYAAPERLVIEGASAGGLLVGAVMNERPELFGAVIAGVPFVDVISTLEDKSIPLSTTDIDEFGDPEREEFYHYMKTYSPYDNVGEREYPALYIYTSLNDSQVGYWEPVKWAAKLRKHQRGARKILLQVNLEAGHGGASGRYDRLRELARCYAFAIAETGAAPVDRRRA